MATMLQYKCPNCGGELNFDGASQQMKCPYCDSIIEVEELKAYDEILNQSAPAEEYQWQTQAGGEWQENETSGMGVFTCQSCGGELVADETTAATHCPFCDSPVVLTGRLSGDLKPDVVIPFKLDKQTAMEGLKKHLCGKRLLPKLFTEQNRIEELKGIYVPFWLFDADVNASIRYRATRTRMWSDSNYNYTETSHYALLRAGDIGFSLVPVDGSSKLANDLMESIEPFDASGIVDFQTAYLSGYMADRYDVTAEQSIDQANARIKNSTKEAFAATTGGYSTVVPEAMNIRLQNGKAKYALYPVWLLTTKWNGQLYTFAMNGQTGKFVGDLPMDKAAYWRWWAIWTGILGAAAFAVIWLLSSMGFI